MDINTGIEDILANPEKYGAPTFEQFAKDPDKYLGREDDLFKTTSEGAHVLKNANLVGRHIYKIFGHEVKSEGQVWKIIGDSGYTPRDFDFKPNLVKTIAGKYDIHIEFVLKRKGVLDAN